MESKVTYALQGVLLAVSFTVFADDSGSSNCGACDVSTLTSYVQNLGEYFGYDLTQYCTSGGACSNNSGSYTNTLFNMNSTYTTELNLFNSYLGSLLGGGSSSTPNANPIVPANNGQGYSILSTLAGQTYSSPSYASPSTENVSVSSIIDQQTYQSDPVSQAVLNILSTPNYTFCITTNSSGQTTRTSNCLFREAVMGEIIGDIQKASAKTMFSTTYNQPFVPQLNSDTLISPLLYATTNPNASETSSSSQTTQENTGLPAQTQAQQAANFIRYAINAVTPITLPSYDVYNNLWATATNASKQVAAADQYKAQATLNNYLTKLRSYTAQVSVGISNLYYMLSKRLPQNPPGGNGKPSSEALNEFIMATWRLYNPANSNANQQWLTKINQGSNASVQKEIAILLAEINYQLYLSRQQQERLLLTQSILLIQNSQTYLPDSDLGTTSASSTSNSASTSSQ